MTSPRAAGTALFPLRAALFLAALSGLLHGASFVPVGAWPFAFVALAPLVAATCGRGPGASMLLGWLAGTVAASIAAVPWLASAARDYFHQGPLASIGFALVGSQVFGALQFAAFGFLLPALWRLRGPVVRCAAIAAAWTALELARARAFGGMPWDLLAHALAAQPAWIGVADLGGTYFVSFVLAFASAALARALVALDGNALRALAAAAAALAAMRAYGGARLAAVAAEPVPSMRVALVQGNVPGRWKTDPVRAGDVFAAYLETTRAIVARHPALVLWPENAVSFLLAPNERLRSEIAAAVGPGGPPVLLGGPRVDTGGGGHARFFNSAWLVTSGGEVASVYDKRQLVPFSEYRPDNLLGRLWDFHPSPGYTPGAEATIFDDPAPFGVLICFEAIYPELALPLVRRGAKFLVNLTNDEWFGATGALEQHFAMTVFRAVETRRALARVTNTGVTGVVGPTGEVLARFPTHVRDAWIAELPLREGETLYVRTGDLLAWACAVATIAAFLLGSSGRLDRRH